MKKFFYCLACLLLVLPLVAAAQNPARAEDQGIVATVNDVPVTPYGFHALSITEHGPAVKEQIFSGVRTGRVPEEFYLS